MTNCEFANSEYFKPIKKDNDRLVTVCASCKQASCWQGIFYCENYKTAGIVDMPISELKKLKLEHPSYWKIGNDPAHD